MLQQQSTEVVIMERKNNLKSIQPAGKPTVPDSKIRQDVSPGGSKLYRGGNGRGATARVEPAPAKPWPTKRSAQHRGNLEGATRSNNQVARAEEAEIGSAARPGSKKLNLNHLLNFTYDCRGANGGGGRSMRVSQRNNRSVWTTRVHKYNKEQFLQANCQFVVEEGHDYSVHSADPDLLVDWDWIEQVRVFSHELPSCPICLYQPVAAKITRCGHLYCWPCMLHYLALSDKTWRKCPICYEAVSKKHLKSVVAQATPCYNVGDEITMLLMQRERGSVIAVPRLASKKLDGQPFRMNDLKQGRFAKLLLANSEQVLEEIISLEQKELESALEFNKDCPEVCFIEDALQQLKERKESLFKKSGVVGDCKEAKEGVVSSGLVSQELNVVSYASAFDEQVEELDELAVESGCQSEIESVDESEVAIEEGEVRAGKDCYYFYQSADGQHLYMHALNAHMLIREYGSLEKCPDRVVAVVVEKESVSMNEDLRRRLRYLAHLPLTCDFEVVELQLMKPLVSDATLEAFAEEINKRRRKRSQRAREENKRERQLKAKENYSMGKVPANRISLGSLRHFPECRPINSSTEEQTAETSSTFSDSLSASPDFSQSPTSKGCGPSFAQMLREGKARAEVRASGTVASPLSSPEFAVADVDSDEERMVVPTFRDSFCAALQDALDNYPSTTAEQTETRDGRKKKASIQPFASSMSSERKSSSAEASARFRERSSSMEETKTHRGNREFHEIVVETHSPINSPTDSSAVESVVDKKAISTGQIGFFSGNPFVEITKGILHLFKENHMTSLTAKVPRSEMLCILAVPASTTTHDLLQFMAPCSENINHVRIIRDSTPNQYMVLIKFGNQSAADEFYKTYNGARFNSIEADVCHLVYIAKVETTKEAGCLPLEGHTELPTCPVCLERMDESVDGILTILCNHSFHAGCLSKWGDTSCPVCRHCQTPEVAADNRCSECHSQESLWICLICGHVGCGRYVEGHAYNHFLETSHTYAMQLGNNRVWDYAGDNYVHRLLQNKADGKLVELNEERSSVAQDEKLDSMQLEYTYLLTSQLESQRLYFEEKISIVELEAHNQIEELKSRTKMMVDEYTELKRQCDNVTRDKLNQEKRIQQLNQKLQKTLLDLKEENQINECLRSNQERWQEKVHDLEVVNNGAEKEIDELKEQLRDVMFFLEAQKTLEASSEVTQEELRDGQIVMEEATAATSNGGKRHRRRKHQR